jgi:hypothetical protein
VGSLIQRLSNLFFVCVLLCAATLAQEPSAKPADATPPSEKVATAKSEEKAALPFQIQLLETHVRFESNGDSRKEVHTIVKINDLAGARQFSRLGFDYNRAFQQVEIPLVKISHANGGTSEILPSAITDAPNPAVQDFPAYHDVRVKSVRILGLHDGDTIEYRVITTTTKHPLAPDFWLEHTFDRLGQVSHEIFQVEMPKLRAQIRVNPETPPAREQSGDGVSAWESYRWDILSTDLKTRDENSDARDITLTSFASWPQLAERLSWKVNTGFSTHIYGEAEALAHSDAGRSSPKFLYKMVAHKIATVDLPFDLATATGRGPQQILASGYGTPGEKIRLLDALLTQTTTRGSVVAYSELQDFESELPSPDLLSGMLLKLKVGTKEYFLDPGLEVAPFGIVPAKLRGRRVLEITGTDSSKRGHFSTIPLELPFPASQRVTTNCRIDAQGTLTSKVTYQLRGDNELLWRVTFHKTPKDKQPEIAQYLALADGFRGKVTSVRTSDPYATDIPFEVEYELTQAKFVDWSKKPVRIPAPLPQIALPDLPGKTVGKIELGTPLDVQTSLKLRLPEGTTVQTPAATSVARDYATFASKYDGHLNTVTASRHIDFLKREIPSDRAADYNAFLRAVQNDQAQAIVLSPPEVGTKN